MRFVSDIEGYGGIIMKMAKRTAACLAAGLVCTLMTGNILGAYTYYRVENSSQQITKGTVYEMSRRITGDGILDVHVLKVPVSDPNVNLSVFNSSVEYGLKESTAKLVSDSGAIAGMNGDLFGMNGNYSVPIGTQVMNGAQITSDNLNGSALTNATFFLTDEGSPFIDYMTCDTALLVNGVEVVNVWAINRIVDLAYPSIVTYEYMADTATLDARIANAYKLVVENGYITYISQKGETVSVPENGYLLMMNESDYEVYKSYFTVGQSAELSFKANIDLSSIQTAISGSGKILTNGQATAATADTPSPSVRAPRTAIGVNQDADTVILMVVDGRSHSIGATHDEMAQLMLEYGAYNAMQLDGGGSSTMVVKTPQEDAISVVNTPSGGIQRKVINAIGVLNKSAVGEIVSLGVYPSAENVAVGIDTAISVFGYDEYYNKIEIPYEKINIILPEVAIKTETGIMATGTGQIAVTAEYMGIIGSATVNAFNIAEIQPSADSISVSVGGAAELSFKGLSNSGYAALLPAEQLSYEVYPPSLGTVENGVFHAASGENGWVRAYFGSISAYITVTADRETMVLDSLDGMSAISFSVYPETVTGGARYANSEYTSGNSSIELSYNFPQSESTQAAYVDFAADVSLETDAVAYTFDFFGDGSGNWLRGRLTDADGNHFTLDFVKNIDFNGWKTVTAQVPEGVVYPVTLDRIYIASLSKAEAASSTVYIDNLRIDVLKASGIVTPTGAKAKDALYAGTLSGVEGYDITFIGALSYDATKKPLNYDAHRQAAIAAAAKSSTALIYGGGYDISPEAGITTYLHDGSYTAYGVNDLYVIKMFASKGGFASTDPSQWAGINDAILQSYTNNIVIQTDINPQDFTYAVEYEMFLKLMSEAAAMGKNIFVVSNSGTETYSDIIEGVRFINLGSIYKGAERNDGYSVLRFRINNGAITYSLEKTF